MDKLVKDYLIHFYSNLLTIHGDRPEALRWTPAGQKSRYALMLEIADTLDGKKILDYGCGKGDFYSFIRKSGITVNYTGMDINPDLISMAGQKYPECTFRVLDIEEEDLYEDFDYIFICGVFNNRVEGAKASMLYSMSKLFNSCTEGLAISGISSHSPRRDPEINYFSPEEITGYVLANITPYVTLRHDRVPYDFTLFLYKKPNRPELTDRD